MNDEIEIKFANVSHDLMRSKLAAIGAVCETPFRLMRRVVIHAPEMTKKNAFIRVRDEGHRVTLTYKQFDDDAIDGAKEYETIVGDFDQAINILSAGGLKYDTYQESRRENWRIGDVEIMLDEWPWLNPYIEIEGPSEESARSVVHQLGFDWSEGIFGGVANLYRHQYPFIGEKGSDTINYEWSSIKFDDPAPELISK